LRKPRNEVPREGGYWGGDGMSVVIGEEVTLQGNNGRLYTPEEKEKRIKREEARLKKIFAEMPEDRRRIAEGLVKEAAYMRVTLGETRAVIDHEGVIERFEQGAQRFLREHPATKVYASFVNRYSAIVKQLIDLLLAAEKGKTEADELIEFDQ